MVVMQPGGFCEVDRAVATEQGAACVSPVICSDSESRA